MTIRHQPSHCLSVLATSMALLLWLPAHWSEAKNVLQPFAEMKVIALKSGVNNLDINGDGSGGLVFVAHRENYNAHSYDIYTFCLPKKENGHELWEVLTFQSKDGSQLDRLTTEAGADCVLRDIRVLRPEVGPDRRIIVLVGQRDHGPSFAQPELVKFFVYRLRRNEDGIPGWPRCYFEQVDTLVAKKTHCDVNEAFFSELGVR